MASNFDQSTHLYWFRRLPAHPDATIEAAALAFRDKVSAYLGLIPPYPEIIWFKPEVAHIASAEWSAQKKAHPEADWAIDANPFLAPCECFRFPREGDFDTFCGFTPANSSNAIGIAVEPDLCHCFKAIAEECVHVLQDVLRPGWRMNNIDAAEAEARERLIAMRDEVNGGW